MKQLLYLSLLLCPGWLLAQSKPTIQFDLQNQTYHLRSEILGLDIAKKYEAKSNYFEAITEYKRYQFLHSNNALVQWRVADLYLQSGNYEKAEREVSEALVSLPKEELRTQYFFYLFWLDIRAQSKQLTWADIKKARTHYKSNSFDLEHLRLHSAAYFLSLQRQNSAKTLLSEPFQRAQLEQKRLAAMKALKAPVQTYSYLNLLWGVVPGGTYFRLAEYRRGLLSFFTVGLLTTASIFALRANLTLTGLVAAFFSFRFYLSSFTESFRLLQTKNRQSYREQNQRALSALGNAPAFAAHIHVYF